MNFDFYIPKSNIIIEVDGDYWHGNMEIYEEKDLKGFQKKRKSRFLKKCV